MPPLVIPRQTKPLGRGFVVASIAPKALITAVAVVGLNRTLPLREIYFLSTPSQQ